MRLFLRTILIGGALALPGASLADNKFCYWNAEGLPYSKVPPPGTGEALFPGGPMQAVQVIINASPQLIYKQACGLIGQDDLVKPGEIYLRWGCSPDSSMGRMVEELASGGALVSPVMSFVEFATNEYKDDFAEQCALLVGIEPICYLVSAEHPTQKDAERYPHCAGLWRRINAFGEFSRGL